MPASRLRFFLASEQNRDHQIDPDLVETALIGAIGPHFQPDQPGLLLLRVSQRPAPTDLCV